MKGAFLSKTSSTEIAGDRSRRRGVSGGFGGYTQSNVASRRVVPTEDFSF